MYPAPNPTAVLTTGPQTPANRPLKMHGYAAPNLANLPEDHTVYKGQCEHHPDRYDQPIRHCPVAFSEDLAKMLIPVPRFK